MNRLRQRIPFKFPSDQEGNGDNRILDEQEQEEVIETLRRAQGLSSQHYNKFLQGCLSFTILLHCWFFISPRQVTPVHAFFPNAKTPFPDLIPFATWFTLLNIISLLNVMLHLPKEMSFPRSLYSIINRLMTWLPMHIQEAARPHIPFPVKWAAIASIFPPLMAVFAVADIPQILWWSLPDIVIVTVVVVRSWIEEASHDMERLEKMKYEAKGV